MNILILEDNPERIKIFQKNLMDETIVVEHTEYACVANCLLEDKKWDVLFLDHDLGGEAYVSTDNENTGSGVARYLANHPDRKPPLIIIHSMNANGAVNIKSLLRDAVVLPFANVRITSDQLKNPVVHDDFKKLSKIQNSRLFGETESKGVL